MRGTIPMRWTPTLPQMPEDVLHHDHAGIHNDAKVNGPNGEQIGRLAPQYKHDDAKEERKRNAR